MEKLIIIRTIQELPQLETYIDENEYIAFDTETTGTDKSSKIIGFSVSAHVEIGYYVILSEWKHDKLVDLETIDGAEALLKKLIGKQLVMHNAVFDCAMVKNNFNISLIDSVHTDTMILAHLLDENRHNGLKELGVGIFGQDAAKEQFEMKESVIKNGGVLTKSQYELYKADSTLLANYGAKDAILTIKLFYHFLPSLFDQGLDKFFYDQESMPLLRGPTYQLNQAGLKVDHQKLINLKQTLNAECIMDKAFIMSEVHKYVKDRYPGTKPSNTFNIGSSKQLSWLLFIKLDNVFNTLTKEGRNLCKALYIKVPYSYKAKREFVHICNEKLGTSYFTPNQSNKTKKPHKPKKVQSVWNYLAADKVSIKMFASKYKWAERYLKYTKNLKILTTYVEGIESRMQYGIIRPSFLQHGTTSGRYSSKNPNFQNLPRDDKRVKSCISSRPGNVLIGADYSQLEPRVFASLSKDERLLKCFRDGDDFYSVIGAEVFDKFGYSLKKDLPGSFAAVYPDLRNVAKVIALSTTYGTTAPKMAPAIGKSIEECQMIIDSYFEKFPSIKHFMLRSHEQAKTTGIVHNLYGRPRRMPKALDIKRVYGKTAHSELPYEARNLLNLSVNHIVQSTGASIMNRAAIEFTKICNLLSKKDLRWLNVQIVMQIHDELVVEGPEAIKEEIKYNLKYAMENTTKLPGVDLIAEPKIAYNLANLK